MWKIHDIADSQKVDTCEENQAMFKNVIRSLLEVNRAQMFAGIQVEPILACLLCSCIVLCLIIYDVPRLIFAYSKGVYFHTNERDRDQKLAE